MFGVSLDPTSRRPADRPPLDRAAAAVQVTDLATAKILDADDYKEIGIKVGTRKKLLEKLGEH